MKGTGGWGQPTFQLDHKKTFVWTTPLTNHHFFYLWTKPLLAWLTSRQGPIHGELPVTAIFWSLPLFLTPLSQAQYLTAPIYEGVQKWPSTKKLKAKMKLKWHHLMLTSSHCSCMYVKVYCGSVQYGLHAVCIGVFDISISHIDYRYIDTFWKYRYRYRYR